MTTVELVESSPIGFKLVEAAWCALGTIFVSNWRMKYWNVPVFALLIASTFGYTFISVLLILVSLTGKPRYFVCVVLTGTGSALNFLAASLMLLRIFVFKVSNVEDEEPYNYVSEGLLALWMYRDKFWTHLPQLVRCIPCSSISSVSAVTMLLDVVSNSAPSVIETHSSSEEEEEDEDEDGGRRKSDNTETT